MPAIPVLVGAAVATGTATVVGTAVVAAVTTATVSTAVATAVGAGVIAGTATLASTGDAGEALKAAVITGASMAVGGAVKGATSSALAGKASEEVTKVASAAAAGGATNTLSALAQGADVGQALGAGALGAAGAGVGEAASIGAQTALPKDVGRVTQGVVAGGAGGATEAAILGQDPLVGALMSAGATGAATAYGDAEAQRLAREKQVIAAFEEPRSPGVGTQYGQPTASVELMERGGVPGIDISGVADDTLDVKTRPGMGAGVSGAGEFEYAGRPVGAEEIVVTGAREPISYVSPTGLARFTPTQTKTTGATPSQVSERDRQMMEITGLTRAPKPTEDIPETTRLGEVEVTGARDIERPIIGETPTDEKLASQEFPLTEPSAADRRLIDYLYGNIGAPMGTPFMGREMGAGTSALAQALSVGDPGALYLGKKGKERRPVWNVESLKLSDELGGRYG